MYDRSILEFDVDANALAVDSDCKLGKTEIELAIYKVSHQ